MRSPHVAIALLAALVASAGCTGAGQDGEDDTPHDTAQDTDTGSDTSEDTGAGDPCSVDDPELTIGTGSSIFQALSALDPLEVYQGPQGGYHMITAVRVCHMDDIVTVHLRLTHEASGVDVADITYPTPTLPDGECCRQRGDLWGYLDTSSVPGSDGKTPQEVLGDQVVAITMNVSDGLGNQIDGTLRVTGWVPGQ